MSRISSVDGATMAVRHTVNSITMAGITWKHERQTVRLICQILTVRANRKELEEGNQFTPKVSFYWFLISFGQFLQNQLIILFVKHISYQQIQSKVPNDIWSQSLEASSTQESRQNDDALMTHLGKRPPCEEVMENFRGQGGEVFFAFAFCLCRGFSINS